MWQGYAISVASKRSLSDEQSAQIWLARLFVLKFVLDPFAYVLTREQYRRLLVRLILCCNKSAREQRARIRSSNPHQGMSRKHPERRSSSCRCTPDEVRVHPLVSPGGDRTIHNPSVCEYGKGTREDWLKRTFAVTLMWGMSSDKLELTSVGFMRI